MYRNKKGRMPGQRPARHPFQLLPQNAGRRAAITVHEHHGGEHEINAQAGQIEPVQKIPRLDRRHEPQLAKADQDPHHQQRSRNSIDGRKNRALPPRSGPPLRKNQREMQQQRGLQQPRDNSGPVDFPVKRAQLSRVLERIQDVGHQAKNVEVHGARGIPPAPENEQADEKIEQSHNAQIIFQRGGPLRRLDDQ